MNNQKSSYWKFVLAFVGIMFLVFAIAVGVRFYQLWRADRGLRAFNKAMEDAAARLRAEQMKDVYGGKTPQETLSMYIDAVEKGDYGLASKYFVLGKQEEELRSLSSAVSDDIKNYLFRIKQETVNGGEYDSGKTYFSFNGKILVNMTLYPSGIWKIIEI